MASGKLLAGRALRGRNGRILSDPCGRKGTTQMSDSVKLGDISALCVACGYRYTEDIDLHSRIAAEFGTRIVCPGCRDQISRKVRDKKTLQLLPGHEYRPGYKS